MDMHLASGNPESPRAGAAPVREHASSENRRAQPPEDVWDFERWSGPEKALLTLVAAGAPIMVWFYVVDHVPEPWADVAAVPILGLGDLIAAWMFVLCYGSARALVRQGLTRSRTPRPMGRHRR